MPMLIKVRNYLYCPVIVCDYCGAEITDAKNGNYEWRGDENMETDGEVFFTHKECCYPFETANGGRGRWMTGELQVFPIYLAANIKLDWTHAKELAQQLQL